MTASDSQFNLLSGSFSFPTARRGALAFFTTPLIHLQSFQDFTNRLPRITQFNSPFLVKIKGENRERYTKNHGRFPMPTGMGNFREHNHQNRLASLPEINGKLAKGPLSRINRISRSIENRHSGRNRFKLALQGWQAFLPTRQHNDLCLWSVFSRSLHCIGSCVGFRSSPA